MLAAAALPAALLAADGVHFDLSPSRARSFEDETPIVLDLDGDGRGDRISPRILKLRRSLVPGAAPFPDGDVEHFVAFALETSTGRSVGTLVQFRFGTENGGHRAYVLGPVGDADGDGRADLAFRVGDGLPEEAIVLLDRGDRFEARSTGVLRCACALDEHLRIVARGGDGEPSELARWDGGRRRFVGEGVVWVIGAEATVRDSLGASSRVVATVPGGTAVRRLPPDSVRSPPAGWLPIALDGATGWISERVVEPFSPADGS